MKKILILLLILAVIIPITGFAIDEYDHKMIIKQEIEDEKHKLQEQFKEIKDPKSQEKIEQKIENIDIFKDAIDLDDAIQKAIQNNDKEELEKLLEDQKQLHNDILKRAGDRVLIANITDPDLSTQSTWFQPAYAALNDFEFEGSHESCWSWNYDSEIVGFIDTTEHLVDLVWSYPDSMYVGNWPCDYMEHDEGTFIYSGLDDDINWYVCGANLLGYHYGAASYPCPWMSSGD